MPDPVDPKPVVDNAFVDNPVVAWLDQMTDAPTVYEPHHHVKIWAAVLTFAFFLLDMIMMRGNPRAEPLIVFLGGSLIAQAALLTAWLALGNSPLLARLVISSLLVALTLLAGISSYADSGPIASYAVQMICGPLIALYAAAAPIGFLKLLGFRLGLPAREANSIESTSMQFSLLQIFGWTAAAALVTLVARGFNFEFYAIGEMLISILVFDVILWATVWAMLGRTVEFRWVVPVGLLFCLFVFVVSVFGMNGSGMVFSGLLISFAITAGVCLIYRGIGYRLYRLRRPTDEIIAAHALD